ncbi:MAG: hypothetical protein VX278_15015 [Myxococcota bacterium]|nr:hypothetical protein [Myxococcota bacterium]
MVDIATLREDASFPDWKTVRLVGEGSSNVHLPTIFPNVETLSFHYTTGTRHLPKALDQLPFLSNLSIEGTNITDIPLSVSKIRLKRLEIAHNPLLESIPPLPYVQNELAIHHNRSLSALPDTLGAPKSITKWDFAHNNVRRISAPIQEYNSLRHVSVAGNQILQLPSEIASLPRLESLELQDNPLLSLPFDEESNNRIMQLKVHNLPNLVRISNWEGLSNIRSLSIHNCRRLRSLPTDWRPLKLLKKIRITDTNLSVLSLKLEALRNLESLAVRSNPNLTELSDVSLPDAMQNLLLNRNALRDIPLAVSEHPNLRILRMDENQLRTLPSGLCQNDRLLELSLGNNPLYDLCGEQFQMSSLYFLNIQGTQLRTLPQSLALLPNLEILSIGSIPFRKAPLHLANSKSLRVIRILGTADEYSERIKKDLKAVLPPTIRLEEI